MATTSFKMASPSVTNTLLALNNKAKAQTPVPPYEDFGGSIPSTNTYTVLPKTTTTSTPKATVLKNAAPKTTSTPKTTTPKVPSPPLSSLGLLPSSPTGYAPAGGLSSWAMLNPSTRPTYSPVAAPKPAAPVQNRPVPAGVNPGQSTGVGGGPSAWSRPPQQNPSAPGIPQAGGGMQQQPAPPMQLPGAAPQQQVPEGLAQLAAMMADMAPNFSQSLSLNMPFNQKLPFQIGKDFGGDNPYLTRGPGFDPLGILGRSWGG